MWVFNPLDSQADHFGLGQEFSAAARERSVDWTHFIRSKSHDIPLENATDMGGGHLRERAGNTSMAVGQLQLLPEGEPMTSLATMVQQ